MGGTFVVFSRPPPPPSPSLRRREFVRASCPTVGNLPTSKYKMSNTRQIPRGAGGGGGMSGLGTDLAVILSWNIGWLLSQYIVKRFESIYDQDSTMLSEKNHNSYSNGNKRTYLNPSAKIWENVGPTCAPSSGFSKSPPTYRSTSLTLAYKFSSSVITSSGMLSSLTSKKSLNFTYEGSPWSRLRWIFIATRSPTTPGPGINWFVTDQEKYLEKKHTHREISSVITFSL